MLKYITGLCVVALHLFQLYGSKRVVKIEYRPYGPKMCKQLCRESSDSFIYTEEELSCLRIPGLVNDGSIRKKTNSSEGLTTYVTEKRMTNGSTSLTSITGMDICRRYFTGDCSSQLIQNLTREEETRDLDSDKLNPDITLHQACYQGNLCVVKYILSNGLDDINSQDDRDRTPVMVGAEKGHLAVFDFLVSQGCNLSIVDEHDSNILHGACIGGNIDIVKKLIDSGTYDMEGRGYHGMTPVIFAAAYNHREVFNLLVSKGCDITAVDYDTNNILHVACIGGHIDMVKYIMSSQVFGSEARWKNSRGYIGRTPVMFGAREGHMAVFEFLVSQGCNLSMVDDEKSNVLHIASIGGNIDIVNKLIVSGKAGLDSRGKYGRTPLMYSVIDNKRGVFELLVRKGCDLEAVDDGKYNIFQIACRYGHLKMAKYIMSQHTVDVESKARKGRTAILIAAKRGHVEVVEFLVGKACNMRATDDDNNNILHLSCANGHLDMVKYILSMKVAGLESKGEIGQTPVMRAVEYGRLEVVKFLVTKGSDLTAVDDNKNNILHLACKRGFVDIVKYVVITFGLVDQMNKNKKGLSPLDMAKRYGHAKVVNLLIAVDG